MNGWMDGWWLSMPKHDIYRVQAASYSHYYFLTEHLYQMATVAHTHTNGKTVLGNLYMQFMYSIHEFFFIKPKDLYTVASFNVLRRPKMLT